MERVRTRRIQWHRSVCNGWAFIKHGGDLGDDRRPTQNKTITEDTYILGECHEVERELGIENGNQRIQCPGRALSEDIISKDKKYQKKNIGNFGHGTSSWLPAPEFHTILRC